MSNLVKHAQRELRLIGEDPETIAGYLRVIRQFAKMGHSGGSASVAIPVISQLLQYQALSPLTDNPDDWFYHGPDIWDGENGIWQNVRQSSCFSTDAGKTYYDIREPQRWFRRGKRKTHRSVIAQKGLYSDDLGRS
jgi:hypothetical protein